MDEVLQLRPKELEQIYRVLAQDKTTKKRIVWGTDNYLEYGSQYGKNKPVKVLFNDFGDFVIEPRITKGKSLRQKRTRSFAEVFTPAWICNKMINYCDDEWFGWKEVFNIEGDKSWSTVPGKIEFSGKRNWKAYVDSRRLEITCGEAPYIISRYDVSKGEEIEINERIGILDRKLRVVGENCKNEKEWLEWAERAFQSVYGYEMQGDSLILCRKNLLLTFCDYLKHRWNREPTLDELKKIANIIAWNFWQMDGLKGTIPAQPEDDNEIQLSIVNLIADIEPAKDYNSACIIHNWRSKKTFLFKEVKEKGFMKFDYVIGNPPYQVEQVSENVDGSLKNYAPPVYHLFMDESYKIADKVELIHPARFLFNAGSTPKNWNRKMLSDKHFKVLQFEQDSWKIFPNIDIKGGIAITYRDDEKDYGIIETYTAFEELNQIMKKVKNSENFFSLCDIILPRTIYRLTPKMHEDHPEAESQLSRGHLYDMSSNIFGRLPQIFYDEIPNDGKNYVRLLGRINNKRTYKYIQRDYINNVLNFEKYKVIVPQVNGTGTFAHNFKFADALPYAKEGSLEKLLDELYQI